MWENEALPLDVIISLTFLRTAKQRLRMAFETPLGTLKLLTTNHKVHHIPFSGHLLLGGTPLYRYRFSVPRSTIRGTIAIGELIRRLVLVWPKDAPGKV